MALVHGNIYLLKMLFCLGMVAGFLLAGGLAAWKSSKVPGLGLIAAGLLFFAIAWSFDALAYSPFFSPENPFEGSIPHIGGSWGGMALGLPLLLFGLVRAGRAGVMRGKR
ncbi:MAG: hypothetical protein FJ125_02770 [Deltaproteobacteria bacterium]|nr:hypothetical protein [Deltaproteobacteria bacterium]